MHSFLGGQLPPSPCHRDIKLDNTLLDGQLPATVKLCDFQACQLGCSGLANVVLGPNRCLFAPYPIKSCFRDSSLWCFSEGCLLS